jgi:hypothetical protein
MGIHRSDSGCEQITDPKMSVSSTSIRECSSCGHIKPVVAFATFRSRSGELRRRGICKQYRDKRSVENTEQQREYRKQYNKRTATSRQLKQNARRLEAKKFVDGYKEANPCVDCKKTFPAVAMDFDHVRGGKIRNVAGLVSGSYKLELIKEEIAAGDHRLLGLPCALRAERLDLELVFRVSAGADAELDRGRIPIAALPDGELQFVRSASRSRSHGT